ncbi:MAG: SAM-dependent methyltransferase [Variovorax paradoxus]|uniref:SAM-dependent methyltransferase n=1 Tax=Variovorax paradoxus TaxID=34073 RepID=A0A2W5QR00_VARPD|nr:MAG: SAM-dependent methyltransferase [Variovorax paradoxus]
MPVDTRPLPTSPASDRNKAPILAELLRQLPAQGQALEVAAGTGQHAAHFGAALPGWQWQPTEPEVSMHPVLATRCAGLPNVAAPMALDVREADWRVPPASLDLVYAANMVHISPWEATEGLMRGAGQVLRPGGRLVVYGPFVVEGETLAPSNAAFDADLRRRNATWGLRALVDVAARAESAGLSLAERIAMPANNLLLVFTRR